VVVAFGCANSIDPLVNRASPPIPIRSVSRSATSAPALNPFVRALAAVAETPAKAAVSYG
jgi:hypothetical protein